MAIGDYKITDQQIAEKGVVAAPDMLTGTAQENKGVFDRLVRETVAPAFNNVLDALEDENEQRNADEATRQTQEAARVAAEEQRAAAEAARQTAEAARQTAEEQRAAAETARADETAGIAQQAAQAATLATAAKQAAETAANAATAGKTAAEAAAATAEKAQSAAGGYAAEAKAAAEKAQSAAGGAFAPETHAAQHAMDGADPVTPTMIGAATQDAFMGHAEDEELHTTAAEKATWDAKAAGTHAEQHATGGDDAITPDMIGAAPAYEYTQTDLVAGESELESGMLCFVYE